MPATVDLWIPHPGLCAQIDEAWATGARCVSLVGPAGAGKTRTGMEWATRRLHPDRPLVWAELSSAHTASEFEDGVCHALGLSLSGERLRQVLRHQGPIYLVIDNAEQFDEEATARLQQLLDAAPDLLMLVTSRRALGLRSEARIPVGPLPPEQARELFLARARALRADFARDPAEAEAVDTLVERLDGMPLAIELTAARSREMGAVELLERLDRRLELLVRWRWQGPPRHRSLQAALDASWELLDAPTQRTLAELSVFRGGFDSEAPGGVCSGPGVGEHLARLRAVSLISREPGGRQRLLVSVRDYAALQLRSSPTPGNEPGRRHLRVFSQRARQLGFGTPAKARVVRVLGPDRENLRIAAEHGLDLGMLEEASFCTEALGILAVWNGHLPSAQSLVGRVLATDGLSRGRELSLRLQRGTFFKRLGRGKEAEQELRSVIELSDEHPRVRSQARVTLAAVLWNRRRLQDSVALLEEALIESRAVQDEVGECHACAMLARFEIGDIEARAERAVELALRMEAAPWQAFALGALADLHGHRQGRVDLAERELREAIDLCVEAGHTLAEAANLNNLGLLFQENGRVREALPLLERAVELHRAGGNTKGQGIAVANLGRCSSMLGHHARAEQLGREALVLLGDREHRHSGPLRRYLGLSLHSAGQRHEASEVHRTVLELALAADDVALAAVVRAELVEWSVPSPGDALEVLEESVATLAEHGSPRCRATVGYLRARCLRRQGRHEDSLDAIRGAKEQLEPQRDALLSARMEMERSKILTLLGQPEPARRGLNELEEWLTAVGLGVDTPVGGEARDLAEWIATSVPPTVGLPQEDSVRKRGTGHGGHPTPSHHRKDDRSPA